MATLRKRVIHGIGWRSAADASNLLLHIALTAVLARLLAIADFGLVAMCFVFLRFVRSFTDIGFGSAVIQRQDISEGQVSAIFLLQGLIKLGVCLLCIAAAPLAAAFFEEPQLTPLIRVLAVGIVLDGLAFPQTLLRKRLEFRGYSILEIVSLALGGALGIAMAFAGFGAWSLVGRTLLDKSVHAGGVWLLAGWRPRRPDFRGTRTLVHFSLNMFGSNIVYFWSQNFAAIILGKLMGAETLGLFNVAYNLAIVPAQKVQSVLTTVLTPAFATRQTALPDLSRHVHASLFSLGSVFVPMMVGMAAVAPSLVVVLYGGKWQAAGGFLMGLAFIGLLKGLEHLLRSVLIATGRPATILRITILETLVALPLISAGTVLFDAAGAIGAYLVASACSFALTVRAVQAGLGDPTLVARALLKSALVAGGMFVVVVLWPIVLATSPAVTLAGQTALGAILYLLLRMALLRPDEKRILGTWPVIGRTLQKT